MPGLGDVPRHLAGRRPVQLYLKGFPAGGASEAAWRQDRVTRAPGGATTWPSTTWSCGGSPRTRSSRAARPSRPPGWLPGSSPPAVAPLLGSSAGSGLRTTVVRYQPEASATLRVEVDRDGGPTVFAKHLADGTATAIASRHRALWSMIGPASRSGSPNRWPPTRYAGCCGPAGCQGTPWRKPCPRPAARGHGVTRRTAGGFARILRARHAGCRCRRPARGGTRRQPSSPVPTP